MNYMLVYFIAICIQKFMYVFMYVHMLERGHENAYSYLVGIFFKPEMLYCALQLFFKKSLQAYHMHKLLFKDIYNCV